MRYEFDGATTDFAITFPYLGQENFVGGAGTASEFIHVFIGNNPASGWHMPDNSTVRFDSPIVSGTLTIRRYTPIGKRQVDYQGGSTLSERKLDRDKIEDTYKFQENLDRLWEIYQFLGPPDYIKHFERISDGATATFTLFDSEEINETAIVREAEVLVRVGGAHLLPGDYQLGKDGDGYVTVTLDEVPPSGVLITFTTLTSGDPQTIDVNLVIPDGSIGWEKLTPPLLTRQTWPILVDIDDGAEADAADGQVLIWDGDGGGTTSLSQRTLDHNDITDFDAGVRQNSITSLAAPTIALSMASHRITNLSDGINPTDAATVGQISAFGEVFP